MEFLKISTLARVVPPAETPGAVLHCERNHLKRLHSLSTAALLGSLLYVWGQPLADITRDRAVFIV